MARIRGAKEHAARLRRLTSPEAQRQIGAALFAAGSQIETDAAISITTGAVSGKNHVPSAPGEPPNADTHVLDRSIETNMVAPLHAQVSANAPYAVELEFGTSKMAERPYMRPATAKNRKAVTQMIRDAVARIVRVR
ncbi:HK97 gp10 family phage protein [Rhizorhabdus wittichii]|uniref:HK97 gp10 family phage protein n=1 Tax=Rhizorhabdus wittichii TaxID=160791 RepID=A0A975CYR4_9SPHN|nr:HK97-gp10 family putative phage morphogenesis protein [Rhizorhabdus wittichii]QTH19788.1 HK97 gp10 family phage protein [Rhizorhabdus wittichii]